MTLGRKILVTVLALFGATVVAVVVVFAIAVHDAIMRVNQREYCGFIASYLQHAWKPGMDLHAALRAWAAANPDWPVDAQGETLDQWGTTLRATATQTGSNVELTVSSAGKDRRWGTWDDVRCVLSWVEEAPTPGGAERR